MDTTKREAILAKVRALKAKTTENGCSEAEAMAAAQKVAELMEEYQIAESDIETVRGATYGAGKKKYATGTHRRAWHPTSTTWLILAKLCGCEVYRSLEGEAVVFGEKEDVQTAFYLFDLMIATSESEYAKYPRKSVSAKASFMHGFVDRVILRVHEMIKERERKRAQMAAENNACRELMVVRDQIVKQKYEQYKAEKGLKLRSTRSSQTTNDLHANAAGHSAGGRVSFAGGGARVGDGAKRIGL